MGNFTKIFKINTTTPPPRVVILTHLNFQLSIHRDSTINTSDVSVSRDVVSCRPNALPPQRPQLLMKTDAGTRSAAEIGTYWTRWSRHLRNMRKRLPHHTTDVSNHIWCKPLRRHLMDHVECGYLISDSSQRYYGSSAIKICTPLFSAFRWFRFC